MKQQVKVNLLLFSVSWILAYNYLNFVILPYLGAAIKLQKQIIEHQAGFPYNHRILVPVVTEKIISFLQFFFPYKKAFYYCYFFFIFAVLTLSLIFLYRLLTNFFPPLQSLVGVLFTAAIFPLTMHYHFFQPWSLMELLFTILVMTYIYKKQKKHLAFLIFIATFNRATSVFYPLMFFLHEIYPLNIFKKDSSPPKAAKKICIWAFLYFFIWSITFFSLRYFIPQQVNYLRVIKGTLSWNLLEWKRALFFIFSLGGFFWFFIYKGIPQMPDFFKKLFLVVPFYLLAIFLFGVWYEVRLLLPIYPILLPAGLTYLFSSSK